MKKIMFLLCLVLFLSACGGEVAVTTDAPAITTTLEPVTLITEPIIEPEPEPVQQAEPEPIKQTAKPCAAPPAPVKKYDWELIFDEFLATLTSDQRREFIPLFALIPMERLPKYQIGGNNRLFFLMFFIYLGHERTKVSDGLMHKIYKYTASLYK